MLSFYIPGTSREKQKAPRRVLKEACLLRKNVRDKQKTHPGSDVHKTV